MLQQLDADMAGEFLVLAATLLEIKTRMLLPTLPAEEGAEGELVVDPRTELVRQLLEYKAFKDAAGDLREAAELQATRFARTPERPQTGPKEIDLEDVQVWDLLTAFGELMEAIGHRVDHHDVIYDDTPVELYAEDLLDRLRTEGALSFSQVFEGRTRSEMIGLFLALLELMRLQKVTAAQDRAFGEIHVCLNPDPPQDGPNAVGASDHIEPGARAGRQEATQASSGDQG